MRSNLGRAITGLMAVAAAASLAWGQAQTISARPGLVNYVEGEAFLNGYLVGQSPNHPVFLNSGDSFTVSNGKAEILLMPGVFLRVGDQSQIRMIAPSLVDTKVELLRGEAIIEALGMLKGMRVEVGDAGALMTIATDGLFRIRAGDAPTATVFEGSLEVALGTQKLKLGKGRETQLTGELKARKADLSEDDELYAWSEVRSQYEAAASYQAASALAASGQSATGWYFLDVMDCWAWLPRGVFFSSFGWGFYPTWQVGGATLIKCPVLEGGHWRPRPVGGPFEVARRQWMGLGSERSVPVDPKHPPVMGLITGSPAIERSERPRASLASAFGFTTAKTDHGTVVQRSSAQTKAGWSGHSSSSSSGGRTSSASNSSGGRSGGGLSGGGGGGGGHSGGGGGGGGASSSGGGGHK